VLRTQPSKAGATSSAWTGSKIVPRDQVHCMPDFRPCAVGPAAAGPTAHGGRLLVGTGVTRRLPRPMAAPSSTWLVRSATSCSATLVGRGCRRKPLACGKRALDREHRAYVRCQIRLKLLTRVPRRSPRRAATSFTWHHTTKCPTISWASRNGTPRSVPGTPPGLVASVNPAGASSRSRFALIRRVCDQAGHRRLAPGAACRRRRTHGSLSSCRSLL